MGSYPPGMRRALASMLAVSLFWLASPVRAQPSAQSVLTDMGVSEADRQRVLNREFVSADISSVSDRDLGNSIVFMVKTTPDALAKQLVAGELTSGDPQVKVHGTLRGEGSPADLAGLQISSAEAQALGRAKAGSAFNLATSEIAALNAVASGDRDAVQRKLHDILLARYRAYRAGGLAGIAPYDRGGSSTDVADELRKATEAAKVLRKHMPAFHAMLLGYPKATAPNTSERFSWALYDVNGTPTYVLTHIVTAAEGPVRGFAQRQFYVSTAYNVEQALGGFLPVQGGTIVVYAAHAFTDQVAGLGGAMKRGIGRRVMAEKLRAMFEADRKLLEK
jgi:hypothetical protein